MASYCLIHFDGESGQLARFTEYAYKRVLECREIWKTLDGKQREFTNKTSIERAITRCGKAQLVPQDDLKLLDDEATETCVSSVSKTWVTENIDSIVNSYIRKWLDIPISGTLSTATIRYINNSLPTRQNLARWGLSPTSDCSRCLAPVTLLHVVAGCQSYLERFTWRHDSVLNFLATNLQTVSGSHLYVDLSGYKSPSIITGDTYRPDLLLSTSTGTLYIVELTVGFESNLQKNVEQTTHASEPSKKLLRSAVNASSKTKSKYVLAPVCIICKKEKSFVTDTARPDVTEDDDVRAKCKYEESFNVFCERFVKEKLIDNEEIYYMKKIEAEFVRTVATVENCDASGYRRFRLKERLIERFPQLVFHTPYERNRSAIVYAQTICQGVVAEHYLDKESQTSQSEMESEDEVLDDTLLKNHENVATLKELLNTCGESF
ncbi:Hypothetical predicted protein [Paramuricea clavata]|uniref:Uncharacterized protein n=1 Tax=Paramuricea clavata TaxID=317549 RepID=A0A7D9DZN2_PARCT|nr:Hypothetical predicted protein [Paramuricea clavata]